MSRSSRAWAALAALLAACAVIGWRLPNTSLDWQPALAWQEPWRAVTAIAVHYSAKHLIANLVGAALVGALGVAARVPMRVVGAWAIAWPLTQLGLLVEPGLTHYGGLSGVLHAGVAVVAVYLLAEGTRPQRGVGAALLLGLIAKVVGETPWGPPLRHPAGWDIAVAPLAHATGLVAGAVCALAARLLPPRATA